MLAWKEEEGEEGKIIITDLKFHLKSSFLKQKD